MTIKSDSFTKDFKEKIKSKVADKFDLSVIGRINLAEAEEIAKEVLFLNENDIMNSLEDFELVPIKSREEFKNESSKKSEEIVKIEKTEETEKIEEIDKIEEIVKIEEVEEIVYNDIPADIAVDSDAGIDEIDALFDDEKDLISDDKSHTIEHTKDPDFDFFAGTPTRDDYKKNIYVSDDYFVSKKSKSRSGSSEILGLIPEESDSIRDKLFSEYYKKNDLILEFETTPAQEDLLSRKWASGAKTKSAQEDALLSDELTHGESKLIDITDSIIILEDKEKLIELTSEFPEKRDHLVKLLSYLDGLFEKLPEDVIRKFAESEYFDLYSKILKDMDL